MKILHVCLDYPPRRTRYGSGPVTDDLLTAIADSHHEIVVLTPGRHERGPTAGGSTTRVVQTPPELSERHLLPADRPTEMFASPGQVIAWNAAAVQWLAQVGPLGDWTPDVIFNDGWTTQRVADHIADQCACPVVTTAHVIDRHYVTVAGSRPRPADPQFRTAEERTFRNSRRVIVPSSTACELATHYFPDHAQKIRVVPHGLDWAAIDQMGNEPNRPPRDSNPDIVTAVYVGRISSERGWQPFLDAFCSAYDLDPRLRLRVIGDGTRLHEASEQYRHPAVTFCGALSRAGVVHELLTADIFCNPAVIETFGVAELEAMGAGLAVISNSGFGKHTHIEHLVTGVRVPVVARDGRMEMDTIAWSGWLTRLASDTRLRRQLGTAARSTARTQYPINRMTGRLLDVFNEAIHDTNPGVTS